jgi:hypothetical protein
MFVADGNGALVGGEKGLAGRAADGIEVWKSKHVAVEPLEGLGEKGAPGIELAGQFADDENGRATVAL